MKLRKKCKVVFHAVVRICSSKQGLVLVGFDVHCLKCLGGMGGAG